MTSEAILALEDVARSFGGVVALKGISFVVEQGERRAIIGPNGAGKTTLFNIVGGAISPSSGRVRLFGADITRLATCRRAALGLARTFQINNLFPALSLHDNLLLAVQALDPAKFNIIRPINRYKHFRERVDSLLDAWELTDRAEVAVSDLSYGEQRQVEILMALAGNPRVLLLDEPTAGLSPGETSRVISLLQGLSADVTVLFVEHDMDVAFQVATNMTVLNHGEMVAQGSPQSVRQNPKVQEVYLGSV